MTEEEASDETLPEPGGPGQPGGAGGEGGPGSGGTGGTGGAGGIGKKGDTGKTGQTGPEGPQVLSRNQVIALFAFVVFCFALLAWRTETADDNIQKNTNEIADNADDLAIVQKRTSDDVLCPLYSVFVDSIQNAPPNAADSDGDGTITAGEQKRYDEAVKVIRDGYRTLGCKPLLELDP